MKVAPWFERWPERLDWELAEYEKYGMRVEAQDRQHGLLRLDVVHSIKGVTYELAVEHPPLFPIFRPVVRLKSNGVFSFHQAPFTGGLCLIARDPEHWTTKESVAHLIFEQLPKIIGANAEDEERADDVEEHAPEPVREYYQYAESDYVVIDSAWSLPRDIVGGTMTVGLLSTNDIPPLRAAVLEVRDPDDHVLARADSRIAAVYSARSLDIRWVRADGPVMHQDGTSFWDALSGEDRILDRGGRWTTFGANEIDLVGVVYEDETRYTEYGDDWVFLVRGRPTRKKRQDLVRHDERTALIRSLHAGPGDMTQRVPQLRTLAGKKILLVGLGALGAPASNALARAGLGRLGVMDFDFVDPATAPRWPQGLMAAGLRKVVAVQAFLAKNYPYTTVEPVLWRLGDIGDENVNDIVALEHALEDVDLIIDATANTAANHALADVAWQCEVPLVVVTATAGAWGGLVTLSEKGRTACWSCYNAALGTTIPLPPEDRTPAGRFNPIACSETTFTGAGFDLTPLADEAVRVAIARLCESETAAYPSATWHVERLALRDEKGGLIPPCWTSYVVPPTADCPYGECGA